jgi:ABC-type nitrate/sulfonate/bicarbonate transport system permease component
LFRTPTTLYLRRAALALAQLVLPFVVVAILWEGFAIFGPFPPRLFPRIETIVSAFVRLTVTGILPLHAFETLLRLAAGFLLGSVVGVTIGMLMGRYRWAEDLLVPVVSVGTRSPVWPTRRCSFSGSVSAIFPPCCSWDSPRRFRSSSTRGRASRR